MKKTLLLALLFGSMTVVSAQSKQDCNWPTGFSTTNFDPLFGTAILSFCEDSLRILDVGQAISFSGANAAMSDQDGNLLFYTNGISVANAQHQIMPNGDGLSPQGTFGFEDIGLPIPQGALALPLPGHEHQFVLFHEGISFSGTGLAASPLYYSMIDMSLDGGAGDVFVKNEVLSNNIFDYGKLTAIRHANGRDWWVIAYEHTSDRLRRFLLTPEGITDAGSALEGAGLHPGEGQAVFSPDGALYAQISFSVSNAGLFAYIDILSFDRCTGEFSILEQIAIPVPTGGYYGIAFSPDSKLLYVSLTFMIIQFDVTAADIFASKDTVAITDGVFVPGIEGDSFPAVFSYGQLAPDGKIYFGTDFLPYFHVIAHPDTPGAGCEVIERAVQLPYLNMAGPNFPNFNLGVLQGSPCDSIISSSTTHWPLAETEPLHIFPNPAHGHFTVALTAPATRLRLYDSMGRQVLVQSLTAGQPEHRIALPPGLPAGVYVAVAEGSEGMVGRGRVVVVR
ncbi:MAG: T9SS type A sorting domain-containing protein [Saprospiraceae bacterium]|nr:T9SS type A sorting domain-containing protein [Saprospiraceae bacterium]